LDFEDAEKSKNLKKLFYTVSQQDVKKADINKYILARMKDFESVI
jgi:hypothetical protein